MSPFFVLRDVAFIGPMAYFERERSDRLGVGPDCPACGGPVGPRTWLPPKHSHFGAGTRTRQAGDLVFGTTPPFLASQRFVQAWDEEGLTGVDRWDPVQVKGRKAGEWFHPVLPPPTVRADFERMEIEWKQRPTCEVCRRGYSTGHAGLGIQSGSWEGQALFGLLDFPGVTVVSSDFRRWAESNAFENIEFVPVDEYGYDDLRGELRRGLDGEWQEVRPRG